MRVVPSAARFGVALAGAVLLAAAGPGHAVAQSAPQPAPGSTAADSARRAGSPAARPTYTEGDVRFMSTMIGHHAQAITMARMAATHGASPAVRTLAARIINAQQDEIATMQQWLRERNRPVPQPFAAGGAHDMQDMHDMAGMSEMPGMAGMSGASGAPAPMLMPGMLTAPQMAQLDRARGLEFDRLFLTGMIQHHRGAVGMVKTLFDTYGAGQDETVFKFASDVNVDQTTEIARMQQMLADVVFGTS